MEYINLNYFFTFKMKILHIFIFYTYMNQELIKLCLIEINKLNNKININMYYTFFGEIWDAQENKHCLFSGARRDT